MGVCCQQIRLSMIKRLFQFASRSTRNKLRLLLPFVTILFLSLPVFLCILFLRQHINAYFINEQEKKFTMMADRVTDESAREILAQAFMGKGLMYIQIKNRHGEVVHEE